MAAYRGIVTKLGPGVHVEEDGSVRIFLTAGADTFNITFSAKHAEEAGKQLIAAAKKAMQSHGKVTQKVKVRVARPTPPAMSPVEAKKKH